MTNHPFKLRYIAVVLGSLVTLTSLVYLGVWLERRETCPACSVSVAESWNPRPAILEHAFKLHPKLDATDLLWRVELMAPVETWIVEGPYKHGWLVTGWTVDREDQTVHMDWSKLEPLQ